MPISSEFVTLCQSQVALLTQGLGAALSIVYLTEEFSVPDTQLIPVVAFPEAALNWGEEQIVTFLTQLRAGRRLLSSESIGESIDPESEFIGALPSQPYAIRPAETLLPQQQMVLPLLHQERVMGLLVTARADRSWNDAEQAQIKQIAQTLTAGCILDWRVRWLAQDLQQQQLLEERKADLFDDLLHQFRNPLTALRTFGKLLVKRLRPGDGNRSVAESIVRESDRLQDLLKQLDAAIDLNLEDFLPLLTGQAEATATEQISQPAVQPESQLLLGSAIALQPHRVTEVLQPLLESATAIAQDRQLMLHLDIPSSLPPVLIDLRALREVLNNLIDNALKYTPSGGKVYISVQPMQAHPLQPVNGDNQAIIIADSGPGIPAEDLQHLFERHYRGVQAATAIPGTGLGLTIARELVHQMQGEIQIFSPAVSSGLVPAQFSQSANAPGTAAVVWLKAADTANADTANTAEARAD
jgi:signal transduction histidine kinase